MTLISIVAFNCGQTHTITPTERENFDTSYKKPIKPISDDNSGKHLKTTTEEFWIDSLIENYVIQSKSPLINISQNKKVSEQWIFDQTINTDTANFLVFQIGHDELDNGRTNKRFVTDKWVYVDSLKKRLYEYDITSDSLTLWSK